MIRVRNTEDFLILPDAAVGTSTTEAAELVQAPVADAKVHMVFRAPFDCYIKRACVRITTASAVGSSSGLSETLTFKVSSTAVSAALTLLKTIGAVINAINTQAVIEKNDVLIHEGDLVNLVFNTTGTKGSATSAQFAVLFVILRRVINLNNKVIS